MPVAEGRGPTMGGRRVAEARRRASLTQQQLAEKIGVGRVTITRIENDAQTPSLDVALALARELGEPVEALFGGDE